MRASFKYKVYTSKRNQKANELFGLACWVYNHCIALQKRYYRLYGKYLSAHRLKVFLTKLKKQTKYKNWSKLNSQTIQQIVEKIDDNYKRFFKRKAKRPPTFRGRRRYKSITFKNTGWSLNGNEFVINSISLRLKFFKSREISGDIKTITLKQDAVGDLWICFSLDNVQNNATHKPKTGEAAGFDFGLKMFLTSSNGDSIASPQYLLENIAQLRKESRNLSKKVKGSNNRKRAKKSLARFHRTVTNQRNDFQWKLANELISKYDVLCFEDLHIKAMQMMWGRKISDLSFSTFMEKIEYLSQKHNKKVVKIDRFFASSKTCSTCGHKKEKLELSERSWICPICNTHHKRDENAAKNIKMVGTSTIAGGTVNPALAG